MAALSGGGGLVKSRCVGAILWFISCVCFVCLFHFWHSRNGTVTDRRLFHVLVDGGVLKQFDCQSNGRLLYLVKF